MKAAVVTGAAGAIGTAVCTRLVARGYQVFAVDMHAAGLDRMAGVTSVCVDLTEPDFYEHVLAASTPAAVAAICSSTTQASCSPVRSSVRTRTCCVANN